MKSIRTLILRFNYLGESVIKRLCHSVFTTYQLLMDVWSLQFELQGVIHDKSKIQLRCRQEVLWNARQTCKYYSNIIAQIFLFLFFDNANSIYWDDNYSYRYTLKYPYLNSISKDYMSDIILSDIIWYKSDELDIISDIIYVRINEIRRKHNSNMLACF